MKPSFHFSRKAVIAVLFVLNLLMWQVIRESDWRYATGEERLKAVLWACMVLGTSGWAAYDSTRVRLLRYRSGISYGPIGVFAVCGVLWPLGLIWYAVVRIRISAGRMPEKARPSREAALSGSARVEPWQDNG